MRRVCVFTGGWVAFLSALIQSGPVRAAGSEISLGATRQCVEAGIVSSLNPSDLEAFRQTPEFKKSINELALKATSADETVSGPARAMLATLLGFDSRNANYSSRILRKAFAWLPERGSSSAGRSGIWIEEAGHSPPAGSTVFRPFTKTSPITWYEALLPRAHSLREIAKTLTIEVVPMDGGKGSSVSRDSHRAKFAQSPADLAEGSKATDLYDFSLRTSLAEIRLLQVFADARDHVFKRIIVHGGLGPETVHSSDRLWKKSSFLDRTKSYEEFARSLGNVERGENVVQSYGPSFDEANQLSMDRLTPYGHGFFAQFGLEPAFDPGLALSAEPSRKLRVIFNGEDEGGMPDELAMAYIYESGTPITLFATEKMPGVDKKGGLVGEKSPGTNHAAVTVVDTAQAEAAGQLDLFRSGEGIVSTNEMIFNQDALRKEIAMGILDQGRKAYQRRLAPGTTVDFNDAGVRIRVLELGREILMQAATPDFIANAKKQDGHEFIQPEGTISTAIFNLNQFWLENYGRGLVRVMAAGRENRARFFLPIKFAIDHIEKSIRFKRDPRTFRLIDPTPGHRPVFDLSGPASDKKYYEDVENCWHAFEGSEMTHLKTLKVEGRVTLKGAEIAGDVTIRNPGAEVDITPALNRALSAYKAAHSGKLPAHTEITVTESGQVQAKVH